MEEIDKLREDLLSTEQTKGAALVGYKPSDAYPTDTVGNTLNSLEKQNQTNSVKADQAVVVANDAISKATTAEQNTGNALQKGNNLNDVANKATALSNIGGLPLIDVSTDSSPNKIPRARSDGKIDINWVRDLQYNLSYIQKALDEIKYPDGIIPFIDVDFTAGVLHPSVSFSRASETTYYDSTGTLRTAGINEPAFDHDPETLKPLGIQRFGSVTNIARWSENGAGWGGAGTNPPDVQGQIDWRGVKSVAITFQAGVGGYAGSRADRYGYAWPITEGVQCAYSADLELSRPLQVGEEIVFYATGNSGLTNKTIHHAESSQYVGNFKRIQATGVPSASGNNRHMIYFNNLQNPITVYVSRIQAEVGDKNYVYIPTQASSVTRAADVIMMGSATSPIINNIQYGGLFIKNTLLTPLGTTGARLFTIDTGSASNRRHATAPPFRLESYPLEGGLVASSISSSAGDATGDSKIAISFTKDGAKISLNGGAVVSNTDKTGLANCNRLIISNSGVFQSLTGYISKLQIYSRPLSDEKLIDLTEIS